MKTAYFSLPYYKQGDDLGFFLRDNSLEDALELHAKMMDDAAKQLRDFKNAVKDKKVDVEADCHFIFVNASKKVIDELIKLELVNLEEEIECEVDK